MYLLMTNVQARSMALACSKLLALLFKANLVSEALLHKCLQHLLAQPSNVRAEAAADVLYLIEPFIIQHFERTSAAAMEVHYRKLQHLCTGGCKSMDAVVINDVMRSCEQTLVLLSRMPGFVYKQKMFC